MNIDHLQIIANNLQFKFKTDSIHQISSGPGGGHICLKITSDKDTFFIKQLDPKLDVHDKQIIARYNLCESVALLFSQQNIPAVYAIKNDYTFVIIIENSAYLVYPWIEGYKLMETSAPHALKVAEILAKIHVINLQVPEIKPKLDIHTNETIVASLEKAVSFASSLAAILKSNMHMILSMNDRYHSAIPVLREKTIIVHGDIFSHNIIWQGENQPFLIDWEAIKNWNPTRETIRTCLAWSGVVNDLSYSSLLGKMLKTYINFGGPLEKNHIEAALDGVYGGMINWLLYNIDLVCKGESNIKDGAIKEINKCLESGAKFTKMHPILLKYLLDF